MANWDEQNVVGLLGTAAKIEMDMPPAIGGRIFNNWRDIEKLGDKIPLDKGSQCSGITKQTSDLELYDSVMKMLNWLNTTDPDKLYSKILWQRAIGHNTHFISRKCRVSMSTVNRRFDKGLELLAGHLNNHGSELSPALKIYFSMLR